jgi:hypothetical protein
MNRAITATMRSPSLVGWAGCNAVGARPADIFRTGVLTDEPRSQGQSVPRHRRDIRDGLRHRFFDPKDIHFVCGSHVAVKAIAAGAKAMAAARRETRRRRTVPVSSTVKSRRRHRPRS